MEEKIICSLEEWDSILNYWRPNGSSKTWYLKELKELRPPLMWGRWNVFTEDNEMFGQGHIERSITPTYLRNLEYRPVEQIHEKHIYIINVYTNTFFQTNLEIGFKCISENYQKDIKEGRCKIVMFYAYEGYSGTDGNKDFDVIEKWRKESDFPKDSVYFVCGNLLSEQSVKDLGYGFKAKPLHYFEPWNNKYKDRSIEFNPDPEKYLFLSYNRQPRYHRILLGLSLLKRNLFDRGFFSLNSFGWEIENLPHETNPDDFKFLKENSPFIIDHRYNLHYNLACNITKEDYEKTFISIVTETLDEKGTLFFSEKVWKPLMVGHPFVLYGNRGSLRYLKAVGYKTFNKWIDESYDEENESSKRSEMIADEINKFAKKSLEELKEIRKEMQGVLDHNKDHYNKLYNQNYGEGDESQKFKKILTDIWDELKDN